MTILQFVALALGFVAAACLLPASVFFLQTWFARAERQPPSNPDSPRPRMAVLMPAHDEARGIEAVLAVALPQLGAGDRLLVVADNCSDDTAQRARASGAEAVERNDPTQRGKGYALAFGVAHLRSNAPDVVIILDADCTIRPGSFEQLARQAVAANRPIQALYLMHAAPHASLKGRIAAFAWVVKNQVRPLGSSRLGMPCQLMGTGMAFPWPIIESAQLASGHLVEDMELGMELARRGQAPLFCPDAQVDSVFPEQSEGAVSQRKRWEHGHLSLIFGRAPRLLLEAITRRETLAVWLVLDLLVPPLALFVLCLTLLWVATSVVLLAGGSWTPWTLASTELALVGLGVAASWVRFGRDVISLKQLLGAPVYALSKLPLYLGTLRRKQVDWVRTKRD